ncbi:uncharacterized protein LOC123499032 [Portunus trituberculatus]|uniref:uncharacterized protein LOC123499032 n=1 Tax=Portunus trituberculatus TaxID=210409 RepID=UPI001E1CD883|nr:uncharacterized protein LOC123499032 [Portunus trituberculatus]
MSALPPPPTSPKRFDSVLGRPSVGIVGVTVLPFSELDAEPLGVLQFVLGLIVYLDVLLGLQVYTPRPRDSHAGTVLDKYRAAMEIGRKAAVGGAAGAGVGCCGCGGAFPSCPLSVFNALGGYF